MDQIIPSIQTVINTSSENIVVLGRYFFPIIPFTFAMVVVVAMVLFIIRVFSGMFGSLGVMGQKNKGWSRAQEEAWYRHHKDGNMPWSDYDRDLLN